MTRTWALASSAITLPWDQSRSSSVPITSSPPMPPSSAAAVISPAARPRLPVGNSSVRYTASAG